MCRYGSGKVACAPGQGRDEVGRDGFAIKEAAPPSGSRDARTHVSREMRRWRLVMARGVRAGTDQANALEQASREREGDRQLAGLGKAYMGRLSVSWGALRIRSSSGG